MNQLGRVVVLLLIAGCSPKEPPPVQVAPQPLEPKGLHNVFRITEKLYSGSSPDGEEGFASLQRLGVKTIISVDGATPKVTLAEHYGLSYVHLPVGYDGIPERKAWMIAKAVRDLRGPVYLHCHHGKHRGPTAAAIAQLCLQPTYTPQEAESWLRQAGIDPRYHGLTSLPKTFRRPTAAQLDELPPEFPSIAEVPTLTKQMVLLDLHWDELKLASKTQFADSKRTAQHALQVVELYRELNRLGIPGRSDPKFRDYLQQAERAARDLEQALRTQPIDAAKARAAFDQSQTLCHRCHQAFRD